MPPGCRPCYGDGGGVISGIYHQMTTTQSTTEFELKIAVKLEQWTASKMFSQRNFSGLTIQGPGARGPDSSLYSHHQPLKTTD